MTDKKMDSVLLEVLRCQMQGVVEEMGEMMTRCGHTVFVKETQDFVVALVTLEGEVAACSERIGLWVAIGQNYKAVIDAGGPYKEGDVWFTNDPHESRGLVAICLTCSAGVPSITKESSSVSPVRLFTAPTWAAWPPVLSPHRRWIYTRKAS